MEGASGAPSGWCGWSKKEREEELSHRLEKGHVQAVCLIVPVVLLVVGAATDGQMVRVDALTIMATVADDLFEAGGDFVHRAVDEAISRVLITLEAHLSDRLGRGYDAAVCRDGSFRDE